MNNLTSKTLLHLVLTNMKDKSVEEPEMSSSIEGRLPLKVI